MTKLITLKKHKINLWNDFILPDFMLGAKLSFICYLIEKYNYYDKISIITYVYICLNRYYKLYSSFSSNNSRSSYLSGEDNEKLQKFIFIDTWFKTSLDKLNINEIRAIFALFIYVNNKIVEMLQYQSLEFIQKNIQETKILFLSSLIEQTEYHFNISIITYTKLCLYHHYWIQYNNVDVPIELPFSFTVDLLIRTFLLNRFKWIDDPSKFIALLNHTYIFFQHMHRIIRYMIISRLIDDAENKTASGQIITKENTHVTVTDNLIIQNSQQLLVNPGIEMSKGILKREYAEKPVTEKSDQVKEKINQYIRSKKMLPYNKTDILLMLKKHKIVNYWVDHKNDFYGLNTQNCDDILKILMPLPRPKKTEVGKVIKELSNMGSNYLQLDLDNPLIQKQIEIILYATKAYSLTKINADRISLQSSFNVYLSEYFTHKIIVMYTKKDKIDKTTLIKILTDFKLKKSCFKILDYFLSSYLRKYFKILSSLTSEDSSMEAKRLKFNLNSSDIEEINKLICDVEEGGESGPEHIDRLKLNRLSILGKKLMDILFQENVDYQIYEENKYDFLLYYYTMLPLLYMNQNYPFDINFNKDNDSLGKMYSGRYIFDGKEKYTNIHAKSAYHFKNKHIKIIENIYDNRYKDKSSAFLFINYFYHIALDDIKLQNLVQINLFNIKKEDLLNYILDLNTHRIPIIEQFIKLFKTEEGKKTLLTSSHTEQQNIKILFNFYEKVNTKKYTLRTTLENILVFSCFGFFVPVSIPKYTGREFTIFTPLDITLKLVRCITNVHSTISTDYTEKKSFHNLVLNDPHGELTNDLSTMATKGMLNCEKINKKNIYKYADQIVDNNKEIIKENFHEFNPVNLERLVVYYKIDIYKAIRYLITKESIFLNEEFTVEKDASNSGLQILSLIFKSKSGAKLCGLLHPQYIQKNDITDVYEYVKNMFIEDINNMILDRANRGEFIKKGEYNEEKYINNNNLQWLHSYKRTHSFLNLIDNFLLFIGHNIQILLDRSLWKSLTMPQQYGMTSFSMKQVLLDALKDNNTVPHTIELLNPCCSLIVHWYEKIAKPRLPLITDYLNTQMNISKDIIKDMTNKNDFIAEENKKIRIYNKNVKKHNEILNKNNKINKKKMYEENKNIGMILGDVIEDNIFLPDSYKDHLLKENVLEPETPLKEKIKYIKQIKPIVFTSNTYKWEFQVFKMTPHKIKIGKKQIKFYRPTDEHNISQMFRSLPPIFIHGLDANIVHSIKRSSARHGYCVVTIHDCFLVSSNYLTAMLEDLEIIYYNLYNSNYFQTFLSQNKFHEKYLKNIRDENHPDYLDFKTMCTKHFNFVK